jgi:hypothetical protein
MPARAIIVSTAPNPLSAKAMVPPATPTLPHNRTERIFAFADRDARQLDTAQHHRVVGRFA